MPLIRIEKDAVNIHTLIQLYHLPNPILSIISSKKAQPDTKSLPFFSLDLKINAFICN